MTRFARHKRAQHAGFQINHFDLKSVLYVALGKILPLRRKRYGPGLARPARACSKGLYCFQPRVSAASLTRRPCEVSHYNSKRCPCGGPARDRFRGSCRSPARLPGCGAALECSSVSTVSRTAGMRLSRCIGNRLFRLPAAIIIDFCASVHV